MNQLLIFKMKKWKKIIWVKCKNNPMYSIPVACLIIYLIWF